jgi:hypothetical protein
MFLNSFFKKCAASVKCNLEINLITVQKKNGENQVLCILNNRLKGLSCLAQETGSMKRKVITSDSE